MSHPVIPALLSLKRSQLADGADEIVGIVGLILALLALTGVFLAICFGAFEQPAANGRAAMWSQMIGMRAPIERGR